MISKQKYDLREILAQPIPQIEELKFHQDEFKTFENEESIVICRAKRNDILDPFIFYIHILHKVHPTIDNITAYVNTHTRLEHISEEGFLDIIDKRLTSLKNKQDFKLNGIFIDAVILTNKWNDESLLCETTEEHVFFNWWTTA